MQCVHRRCHYIEYRKVPENLRIAHCLRWLDSIEFHLASICEYQGILYGIFGYTAGTIPTFEPNAWRGI